MAEERGRVVGKIKTVVAKFDGEFEEGKEPSEVFESEEPLYEQDAIKLGLLKGAENATD